MKRFIVALTTLSLVMIGCATADRPPGGQMAEGDDEEVIEGSGTVRFVDLEGGFYGIVDEDGTQYDPINLEDEFKEDGLRVQYQLRVREDMVGVHMWGTYVEVLAIDRSEVERF